MDPAPLGLAHGLAFFFVYKGYYVLCGNKHAHSIGLRQIRTYFTSDNLQVWRLSDGTTLEINRKGVVQWSYPWGYTITRPSGFRYITDHKFAETTYPNVRVVPKPNRRHPLAGD
ncbi:hypothetical protein N7456_013687 [Penicillium angulare]|uniref:Uncharacterized protein n=1 Tax=Penicillium angulare TaxID=116970 RepID=A0A9W9EFU8_9EURO|nr:hypothetical protein N7456_013687 [Penicillium angulare]